MKTTQKKGRFERAAEAVPPQAPPPRRAAPPSERTAPPVSQSAPPARSRVSSDTARLPSSTQLEAELHRVRYRRSYSRVIRSTIYTLITVAAVAILVATLWLPVLQIYGTSMDPTLSEGDIVVSTKTNRYSTGDIIAFYYNNKILVKRVIGNPGDWIDILPDGTVCVNNEIIDEPYLVDKDFGICDLELPYQVPEGRIFVMGDNRSVSLDSRSTAVGCVAEEQIVGRLTAIVWPYARINTLK